MSFPLLFRGGPSASMALAGLFLMLQGCALLSTGTGQSAAQVALPPVSAAVSSPLVTWASAQPPDSHADTILDDLEFGQNVSVRVERNYLSALGMPCRRIRVNLADNSTPAETVAVCQDDNHSWLLAPRVWRNSVAGVRR